MIPEPKWIPDMNALYEYAEECGGKCHIAKSDVTVNIGTLPPHCCLPGVPKELWNTPLTIAFPIQRQGLLEFCDTYNVYSLKKRKTSGEAT